MSEILKNTASQSVFVTVIDSSTGAGKESGVSFTYTAAGGSQGALTNTPTHKGNGQYEVIPSQAETNVDCFSIGWYGSGVVPNCVTILTTTKRLRDLQDLSAGAAMTLTEAGILAIWHQLLTGITTAGSVGKLVKDYLDAAISSRGTLTAGQVRTELATELARILKGLPDAIPGENGGLPTTNGTKLNQTVDLTASQEIDANLTKIGGVAQSATDLKDFADSGYDPATHKVQGVVLADTATTLTNLPAVTADWLTADGVKADAVAKIQNGLATPTNITAGTITTVTNLTNAPTNGDLTATMKTSVQTAADAAVTANTKIGAIETKTANIPASPAAVGSEMALADGAITASKIAAAALSGKGDWNTVAPDNASAAATLAVVQCDKVAILVEGAYWMSYRVAGTATEIMRKQMFDANGDPVTSITTPVAAIQGAA